MALNDWNGNGKRDWEDTYLERQIFEERKKQIEAKDTSKSKMSNTEKVIYIIGALVVMGLVVAMFV